MFGNLHFSGVVASKRKVEVSRKKVSKMRSVNCCTDKMKQDKRKASIVQSKILPWCQISHSAQSAPHGILLGSAFPKPCFRPRVLHIIRFRTSAKAHSFRRSSSPHKVNGFAGSPCCAAKKSSSRLQIFSKTVPLAPLLFSY